MQECESQSPEHQIVEVYGHSDAPAYTRTIATREVIFTCVRCHEVQHEWRYPGPLPRYRW